MIKINLLNFLLPLINSQDYIKAAELYDGQDFDVNYGLHPTEEPVIVVGDRWQDYGGGCERSGPSTAACFIHAGDVAVALLQQVEFVIRGRQARGRGSDGSIS